MNELMSALQNDALVKIRSLCKDGIDLNSPILMGSEYGYEEPEEINILFYAIRSHASIEAIEILLEYGVDLYTIDDDGLSAIDIAIKFRREDVVAFCIDKGMDINISHRKSGITPLLLAACFNNTSIAELLLANGADINSQDKSGLTAKDYAKKLGQKKMLAFLESKDAKHNLYTKSTQSKDEIFNIENREKPTEDMGFDSI
jgi:ankyrin repeat protein